MSADRPWLGGLAAPPQRVFVRAPNWVGDLAMATAAFARLRAAFPGARITCGLRPYLRTLLDGSGLFDDVLEMPKAGGPRGLWRQVQALRAQRFDLAVVLPNSWETGLAVWLARIPHRLGYRQGRSWLINLGLRAERGRPWWSRHGARRIPTPMPTYYDKLLDVLGLPPGPTRGRLVVTPAEELACQQWLQARGVDPQARLLLLNAGASYGASKLWEPDRFAAVGRHFKQRGLTVVLLSGPGEVAMVRQIATDAGVLAAIDPPLPVGMIKPMMARAALLITTDSGPRHIGVAMGVPVVCLIGPNDRRYTDYALEQQVVLRKDIPCSPCQRKVCPLGHRDCMRLITVDEVVAAAEGLLGKQR